MAVRTRVTVWCRLMSRVRSRGAAPKRSTLRTDGPTGPPARHQVTKPATPLLATRPTDSLASGESPPNQGSWVSICESAPAEMDVLPRSRAVNEASDKAGFAAASLPMPVTVAPAGRGSGPLRPRETRPASGAAGTVAGRRGEGPCQVSDH